MRRFVNNSVMTKRTIRCSHCGKRFKPGGIGRPAVYCSPACRQMAYVRRKANRPHPVQLLARDLDSMPVREFIRREIWNVLRQAVLVSMPEPRSMPGSGKPRPPLKIVPRDDDPNQRL